MIFSFKTRWNRGITLVCSFIKKILFDLEIWTLTLDFVIFLKALMDILLISGGYAS